MKTHVCILITGVHHTPAIELIHQLQEDQNIDWTIHYIGHQYPNETHLTRSVSALNIHFHPLVSGKFNRHNHFSNLLSPILIIKALFQSLFLLKKIKPDLVVSFGGYISVPVIVAAKILHLKSITHEQTLTVSLATKLNSYFVNKIALTFPYNDTVSLPLKKIVVTGNLIRREIFNYSNSKYQNLIPNNQPLIYVTGGNQGSSFFNNLIFQSLGQFKKFSLIHQTGINNYHDATKYCPKYPSYFPSEYIAGSDIGWVFHHADIIISRAGANTCQEIDLLNKKAILIPLPGSQQNEQLLNAQWLNSDHPQSTITLYQETLTPQLLLTTIKQLLKVKSTTPSHTATTIHPLVKLIHEMV